MPPADAGIVIATRDRRAALLATLGRLRALPERPRVVVVDNGSRDGTPDAVRAASGDVTVIEAGENLGAGARTLGARALDTRYVAFNDDDSWWAPGALARAVALLDAHPRLALLAARVLVGGDQRLDPTCAAMAASPLPVHGDTPGPRVLGFVACGAVVRRAAFLGVGGFDARYGIGGEEQRLAFDLAAAGWELAYAADVVAHHHPDAVGARAGRRRRQLRNDLWSAWLRRPVLSALRATAGAARATAREDPSAALRGVADALAGAPWVARERRVVPAGVEQAIRTLESTQRGCRV
jgi:GT2 family glycosyltransferase